MCTHTHYVKDGVFFFILHIKDKPYIYSWMWVSWSVSLPWSLYCSLLIAL